ncbi:MAG: Mur ligase family protein [Clostridiaceae bacterium]
MKLQGIKIYEGNNISKIKKVIRVVISDYKDEDVKTLLKYYFKISFLLGFKEKLVDYIIKEQVGEIYLTYKEETISVFIINNIIDNEFSLEEILARASKLKEDEFIRYIIDYAARYNIPYIKLSSNLYQIGYGKKSCVLGKNYLDFENMTSVMEIKNRETLFLKLKYANISTVYWKVIDNKSSNELEKLPINLTTVEKGNKILVTLTSKDEYVTVLDNMLYNYSRIFFYVGQVNFRVICFKNEQGLFYKKAKTYEKIDTANELDELILKIYNTLNIKFMYIDFYYENGYKIVDLGSVFDILEDMKLNLKEIANFLIISLIKDRTYNIPIFSVTGTNGKTTTARLIHKILNAIGYNSGIACTGGIYIKNKLLKSGDTTGFLSARELLKNKTVDSCVLEVARGGILKNGLGYEKAAVAILTSISEDHIGMDGINNIDDLIDVKLVMLEEVDKGGKVVLKADRRVYDKFESKENISLISLNKTSLVEEHIQNGGEAYYLQDENIIHCVKRKEEKLMDINSIAFTHYGKSRSNIFNIMASISAINKIENDMNKIVKAIENINCDLYINPGRQNIVDLGKFKIVLDYGHNSEAFIEVFNLIKGVKPSKTTSIIAAPGDRMDKYITELGKISGDNSDFIIIREQADLRGRKPGETANLLKNGVKESDFNMENLEVIFKEEEAIVYAMKNAIEKEVIILFTQCLDVIIPTINSYLEEIGVNKIVEDLEFVH